MLGIIRSTSVPCNIKFAWYISVFVLMNLRVLRRRRRLKLSVRETMAIYEILG